MYLEKKFLYKSVYLIKQLTKHHKPGYKGVYSRNAILHIQDFFTPYHFLQYPVFIRLAGRCLCSGHAVNYSEKCQGARRGARVHIAIMAAPPLGPRLHDPLCCPTLYTHTDLFSLGFQ